MVAIGERRKFHEQDPRRVAALDFVQAPPMEEKFNHGNNADEQRVPQGGMQWHDDYMNDKMRYDYLLNEHWYNYPSNNNILAYPVQQHGEIDAIPLPKEKSQAPTRQMSIPNTASLDQYLHPELDCYNEIDYENLDILGSYENDNFSVEDLIDLDKVDVCEQDGINFDLPPIKQEKLDNDQVQNLEDMELVLNANLQSVNNNWIESMNNVNYSLPQSSGNEINFMGEQNTNVPQYFNQQGMYNSLSSGQWQTHFQNANLMPPTVVSKEYVVKTEPSDRLTNSCDRVPQLHSSTTSTGLPMTEEELVEMPVSRFNELLTTLTHEQCCEAKDVRRRGKNKKAARLCRKRKIMNISTLEVDRTGLQERIDRIRDENLTISSEIGQLKMNIDNICRMLMNGLPSKK